VNLNLESAMSTARTLVTELCSTDTAPCLRSAQQGGNSCLNLEEARPLTPMEERNGWAQRPYWAYFPERMCFACAAYWHAQRCAQLLHEYHCLAAYAEARKRV
jgi:hypothetical protein